jgi:FkbM family methyltransferase
MSIRYTLGTARRVLRRTLRRRPWEAAGALAGLRFRLPRGFEFFVVYDEYEPEVVAALARLVRPGDVCVDAGANVGVLTLHLARLVGEEGRVVAFEASPENAALLRTNVGLNATLAPRIDVEEAAVSDGSTAWIDIYPGRGGGHGEWTVSESFAGRADDTPQERKPTRVRSISLDDHFPSGRSLDVVKMDIEGAEAQALPGMRRLLRETRPVILLEFHREAGWPGIEALIDAGYRFESLAGEPLPVPDGPGEVPYQFVARAG